MSRQHNCNSSPHGRLQGAMLRAATLLLLVLLASARVATADSDSASALDDLAAAWPPGAGGMVDETIAVRDQPLLLLPQQLAAVERAKRTGLVNNVRSGGLGGLGGMRSSLGGGMGPSLSVAAPIETLRQRYLLELARRQFQRHNEDQILANREMLNSVGKRGGEAPFAGLRDLFIKHHIRNARMAAEEEEPTNALRQLASAHEQNRGSTVL